MQIIQSQLDPFDGPLFCPFCGIQTLFDEESDSIRFCDHFVYGDGEDPNQSEHIQLDEKDICFVMMTAPPMSQPWYIIYREKPEDKR